MRSRRSAGATNIATTWPPTPSIASSSRIALVQRLAVAGTPAECGRALAEICAFPIDQLAVVPFGADRAESHAPAGRSCST